MDTKTVQQLNRLNQHFYLTVADDFDKTRQQPWEGWSTLADSEQFRNCKTVIDLGCGNGRFASFVTDKNIECYVGLDNNPSLLKQAQQYAKNFSFFKLKSFDIINTLIDKSFSREIIKTIKESPLENPFLFTLFGVIHHIPSLELRQSLLNEISTLINTNDTLVVSCWQFNRIENVMNRQIDPKKLDINQMEENDFILDWQRGKTAFRYSHLVTEQEMKSLADTAGFEISDSWESDGRTHNLNTYYLLKKK